MKRLLIASIVSSLVVIVLSCLSPTALAEGSSQVVAWGWNEYGQTNVPSGLSNVVAVAAGASALARNIN